MGQKTIAPVQYEYPIISISVGNKPGREPEPGDQIKLVVRDTVKKPAKPIRLVGKVVDFERDLGDAITSVCSLKRQRASTPPSKVTVQMNMSSQHRQTGTVKSKFRL